MTSVNPNRGLVEVEFSEPLLVSEADDEDATIDAEELQANLRASKLARRWRNFRVLAGTISLLVLIAIFVRLSRWKRPLDFVSHLQPQFFPEYQPQRVKIRYGPFPIPGNEDHNGMKSFHIRDAKAPCENCLIVWMQAGLEFLDSKAAGVEEGMWLHHTVLHNDALPALHNCGKPEKRQRFFASGNERSVVDLSANGTNKVGYWFKKGDTISMETELMNTNEEEQTAMLSIIYEYIPYLPEDFSVATPIWLDVGGCRSEIPIPSDKKSFTLESPAWTSSMKGRVVAAVAHLHDGGVNLLVQRDEEDVCVSIAEYESMGSFEGHKHEMEMNHITRMSECHDIGIMSVGEEWAVKAQYDLGKHEAMLDEHGDLEPVMGIALVYVVED